MTNLSKLRLDGSLKDSIAEQQPSHLAIVISGHDVRRVWKMLGSNGIRRLEKPCQAEALTHAIRRSLEADTGHCERHARLQQVESRLKNLSDRERQILDLIMAGKPNKAIARALDVSKRTVESGRREVHQKNARRLTRRTRPDGCRGRICGRRSRTGALLEAQRRLMNSNHTVQSSEFDSLALRYPLWSWKGGLKEVLLGHIVFDKKLCKVCHLLNQSFL